MIVCAAGAEPVKTQDEEDFNKRANTKKRFASSWDAKAAGAEEGTKADYLSNLGQAQEYNINVTHGTALACSPTTARAHTLSLHLLRTKRHESIAKVYVLQARTTR